MKKLLILFIGLFAAVSCKDIASYDGNPKAATKVEAGSLFANATKNLVDHLASPNVNLNIYRLLAQHWTETTYIDESNYDLSTRPIPQTVWHNLYRDVLRDLKEAHDGVQNDPYLLPAEKKSKLAMIDVLQVLTWEILVDTFGDIPYSQALNTSNLLPAYDDAATIYTDLIARINTDITDLAAVVGNTAVDNFTTFDLIYGGNAASWVKFASSVKLRLGMNLADVNAVTAKTVVESAVAGVVAADLSTIGVFTSNSDNAMFAYLDSPPNTNPIWANLIQSGRKDFVAANTLVNAMNALSDPRRPFYFTKDAGGINYSGGTYGSNNSYTNYSHVTGNDDNSGTTGICATTFPGVLMDYSEVEFYLAEAAARTWNVGGTADTHYSNAIRKSMEAWGVDATSIDTYLLRPDVAYATATGTYKQKIGTQKWLALYNRGYEAWMEWRRLDFPVLVPPVDALTPIPVRYTYPVSEQNINVTNYNAAAAKISGGDKVTGKVFWDVN